WASPTLVSGFAPRSKEVAGAGKISFRMGDGVPKWHAASGRLLLTSQVVTYIKSGVLMPRPRIRYPIYSVYDPVHDDWAPWQRLRFPGDENQYWSAGA